MGQDMDMPGSNWAIIACDLSQKHELTPFHTWKLNRSCNCIIWNEALIQNSVGNDQTLVLDLVPYLVVIWERALYM